MPGTGAGEAGEPGRSALRVSLLLFAASLTVFVLFSYGGVRSPDSEIVYRTSESLALRQTFAVAREMRVWPGFGVARGVDGQLYSVFGPGQAVAAAPVCALAEWLTPDRPGPGRPLVSPSLFLPGGHELLLRGARPADLRPHQVRTLTSFFNPVAGALTVAVFFLLCLLLTRCRAAALMTSVLFGFGTLLLPYTGTFFSEPLATLLVTISAYGLIFAQRTQRKARRALAISGVGLGLAVFTHISAILFAPFFAAFVFLGPLKASETNSPPRRAALERLAIFLAGLGAVLLLLAAYNLARFGDVLETGRTAANGAAFGYGVFVNPLDNLWKLLLSAGKGLALYSPLAMLSLLVWRPFHRRHPALSTTLLAAFLLRLVFIAARSDWHGGWSLGPRLLVMALPLLVAPVSVFLEEVLVQRRLRQFLAASALGLVCIAQQLYFAVGEVFSFYYVVQKSLREVEQARSAAGLDPLAHGLDYYTPWAFSPLLHLLEGAQGPLLLRPLGWSNGALVGLLALVAAALFTGLCWRAWRTPDAPRTTLP